MGWESSLMSWFDIGKLVEASSLLPRRAASTLNLAFVFRVVAPLAGVTSGSFLSTLVGFCGVPW
ncbi:hypothetical protein FC52_GL000727 [Lactobacillus pasteurii DSM 23907 = CRBIP 24.76]|nr:hypothetical protein FC52_GL000727 [Lactobacillus pasteurii DSM 23907 = CRBIP 24.76]